MDQVYLISSACCGLLDQEGQTRRIVNTLLVHECAPDWL
jgi:hypothetical protein